ncbi:unnamed protein product [Urochloa humidicola]
MPLHRHGGAARRQGSLQQRLLLLMATTAGRRVVSLVVMCDADITGPIPGAGLAALRELIFLNVPGISGPIPASPRSRTSPSPAPASRASSHCPSASSPRTALRSLDLSFNSLTGAIPASLAALPNLSSINLGRNRLTGAIPPLLLSKSGAEAFLTLSHNDLTGTIPPEFAAVSFVQVDLSRNALSFDMSALELLPRLASLDVSHNGIRGGVPAAAGNPSQLMVFNVSYNRLCGELPSGMAGFEVYSFQHNMCLCGAPLPACQA